MKNSINAQRRRLLGALTAPVLICELALLAINGANPVRAEEPEHGRHNQKVEHVLLISVDGLHQSDLAWYVQTHPASTMASLMEHGVDYSDASTPFPSDSFPGLVGQVTGGNPSSTGVYYSSANPKAPTDPNQSDWTTDNLLTQQYDSYKVQAVLNWIAGHRHDGSGNPGTPAIFGMNFQSVSTGQKLPVSRTEGDLSGNAAGGYLADGSTPGPVLSNALNFVDQSLGSMVSALKNGGLQDRTAIIVSAKHGQSPMNGAALNRIKDGQIIDALNTAWNKDHQGGDPKATPLVAQGIDDDGIILWLNDRSSAATYYARQFLLNYNDSSASVDGKPVMSAGLSQVYAGAAAAQLMGVQQSDPRVPDVIGLAQYGVVYTSHKAKIAEHGGDHLEDRNVPIVVSWPGAPGGTAVTRPVETTQIAPTILKLLGLNPQELQAIRIEGTQSLF